jgi:hypothetical protein
LADMLPIYRFAWGNNPKRLTMKNRECIIVARGAKNSCLVEFTDNKQREIISQNAIKFVRM